MASLKMAHPVGDLLLRFGVAVRHGRNHLGLTQEELGRRAGLHRSYVADIERGSRNISLHAISNLAEALGVSLSNLFARVDALSPSEVLQQHSARTVSIPALSDRPS
jgi:transcriptional regulator with XRE-family HTH domain